MANYKVEELKDIGAVCGEKLRAASITTTNKLFAACTTKKGRQALAKETGIEEAQILKWANMADLFRVKGIGQEYAHLLEAAGVDTVKELAQRNAENLVQKMEEINETRHLVRRTPVIKSVLKWIAQAKELPRGLEY